jgi:hypothetical protein
MCQGCVEIHDLSLNTRLHNRLGAHDFYFLAKAFVRTILFKILLGFSTALRLLAPIRCTYILQWKPTNYYGSDFSCYIDLQLLAINFSGKLRPFFVRFLS